MNRMQSELQRLYLPSPSAGAEDSARPSALIDAAGRVRCMVMELKGPPSWEHLAPVWQLVQADLELPAPAIAVSGTDGLQLWFSLVEPVAVDRAHAFLDGLRLRYLPDMPSKRLNLMPVADALAPSPQRHARLIPALQQGSDNWSAFVAQDLAPIFADAPWLDVEPNEEGQATLLRGLEAIKPAAFEAAWHRLGLAAHGAPMVTSTAAPGVEAGSLATPLALAAQRDDPRRFLLRVMNDEAVSLALRIEAAKALLQLSPR